MMPSKTKKQAAAMKAAAYGPKRKGGIPKKVAKEYVKADKRKGK
jgi:hypothetical protein